jgi:hypothetical protein
MYMDKEIAKIGDYWSDQTLIQHINQLVCGELVDGFSKGLMKNLKELGTFKHGVSVGFGNGDKNLKY